MFLGKLSFLSASLNTAGAFDRVALEYFDAGGPVYE